jgi:hypothetical protein
VINISTVAAINKGTSRSPELFSLIQELFWCSVSYNFKLSASYIPGKLNIISDRISRMHDRNAAWEVCGLLYNECALPVNCHEHLTQRAFVSLQVEWSQG